jgi:sporulation protein YtfJ
LATGPEAEAAAVARASGQRVAAYCDIIEIMKEMVDVNTVIGDAVETGDGGVIIPISRVSFGFAAGGGEYQARRQDGELPFGGGSGAGVSVQPVGFLVVRGREIRLLPVDGSAAVDRLIDLAPELIDQLAGLWGRGGHGEALPAELVRRREPALVRGSRRERRREEDED